MMLFLKYLDDLEKYKVMQAAQGQSQGQVERQHQEDSRH